jgi:hypothetical protein
MKTFEKEALDSIRKTVGMAKIGVTPSLRNINYAYAMASTAGVLSGDAEKATLELLATMKMGVLPDQKSCLQAQTHVEKQLFNLLHEAQADQPEQANKVVQTAVLRESQAH